MSTRFSLESLNPDMRRQAAEKLRLQYGHTAKSHFIEDDDVGSARTHRQNRVMRQKIEHNGETLTDKQWAARLGLDPQTFVWRLKNWPIERVFVAGPARKYQQAKIKRLKILSDPEERLAFHLKAEGLDGFVRQYRFDSKRQWRFDFGFPEVRLAVEVDGGAWTNGRHVRGSGFAKDCEKGNAAVMAGWRVLHYLPNQVRNGRAVLEIKRALEEFRT